MKRIIVVFFAIALLFGCSASYAESITFRGVPWGSAYSDTLEILNTMAFTSFEKNHGNIIKEKVYEGEFKTEVGFSVACKKVDFSVAGYQPKRIVLSFAFNSDTTGKIKSTEKESVFYQGTYVFTDFDRDNALTMTKDLKEKLEYLYGNVVSSKEEWPWPFSPEIKCYLFETEDCYILLKYFKNNSLGSNDPCEISINYYWINAEQLLEEVDRILNKQNITQNNEGL